MPQIVGEGLNRKAVVFYLGWDSCLNCQTADELAAVVQFLGGSLERLIQMFTCKNSSAQWLEGCIYLSNIEQVAATGPHG